jgi:hypothetical protein
MNSGKQQARMHQSRRWWAGLQANTSRLGKLAPFKTSCGRSAASSLSQADAWQVGTILGAQGDQHSSLTRRSPQ